MTITDLREQHGYSVAYPFQARVHEHGEAECSIALASSPTNEAISDLEGSAAASDSFYETEPISPDDEDSPEEVSSLRLVAIVGKELSIFSDWTKS